LKYKQKKLELWAVTLSKCCRDCCAVYCSKILKIILIQLL